MKNLSIGRDGSESLVSSLSGSPQTLGLALLPLHLHNLQTTSASRKSLSPKEKPCIKEIALVTTENKVKSEIQIDNNPLYGHSLINRAVTLLDKPGKDRLNSVTLALDRLVVSKDLAGAVADLWRVADKFCLIDATKRKEELLMEAYWAPDGESGVSDSERNKRFLTIITEFNKRYGSDISIPRTSPKWSGIEQVTDWFEKGVKNKLTSIMTRLVRSFGQERYTADPVSILLLNEYGLVKASSSGIYAKCVVEKAQFTRIFLPMNLSREIITLPVQFLGHKDKDVKRSINWQLITDYSPEGKIERFRSKVLRNTGSK